jgi:hypothetical protein
VDAGRRDRCGGVKIGAVEPRCLVPALLERVERESCRFFCPGLADEFVRCEALERLEPFGEVVGGNEVGQMAAQLVMGFVSARPCT